MPRKGLSLVAAALVALLAALLAATPCKSEEDAVGGETLGPLSPVLVSLVSQQAIVPVLGSDGRYHVLYELEMLNTLGAPADLRSVPPTSSRASICNHVVIGMEGGLSAVYAHLEPGSVRVKVGDQVEAGQV